MKLKYLPLVPMSRVGLICLEHEVEDGEWYIVIKNVTEDSSCITMPLLQASSNKHIWKRRSEDICLTMYDSTTYRMLPDNSQTPRYISNPKIHFEVLIIEGPTE
jgi:5-methylcytosine-specific restriction endonuclease McrA